MQSKEEKDISDFMLKEYEHLAEAYFNSHEITAKWIKYYLLVMAAPFSLIAFIYKGQPNNFNIFSLSDTLAIFIGLSGALGLLIALITLNVRLDTTMYARAVNGVRKFFWDKEREKNKSLNIYLDESKYRVLPDNVKQPKFFKIGDLFWLTLLMGIINSFYLSIGISQMSVCREFVPIVSQKHKLIFFSFTAFHIIYYLMVKLRTTPNLKCVLIAFII